MHKKLLIPALLLIVLIPISILIYKALPLFSKEHSLSNKVVGSIGTVDKIEFKNVLDDGVSSTYMGIWKGNSLTMTAMSTRSGDSNQTCTLERNATSDFAELLNKSVFQRPPNVIEEVQFSGYTLTNSTGTEIPLVWLHEGNGKDSYLGICYPNLSCGVKQGVYFPQTRSEDVVKIKSFEVWLNFLSNLGRRC